MYPQYIPAHFCDFLFQFHWVALLASEDLIPVYQPTAEQEVRISAARASAQVFLFFIFASKRKQSTNVWIYAFISIHFSYVLMKWEYVVQQVYPV